MCVSVNVFMVSALNKLSSSLGLQQQQNRTVTLGDKILLIVGLENQASWFLVYTLLVEGSVCICQGQSEETDNLGSHPNSAICQLCDYEKINSFSQPFGFLTIHVDDKSIFLLGGL